MKICLSCEGVTDTQAQRCGHCGSPLLPTDAVHYPARRGELDSANPLLGTVLDGKYRLLSVLGRGGLGTVFRAQHIGSLATVALKLLHPRFSERPEYRRALIPEARRAATVVHQRCARLLDVGEGDEGITYLAMELVEGQTLDELMQQGPFAPSHTVDVLLQVADALAAVHDAGLVHCDLSPRNVMVTAREGRLEAKVLDFGIARSVSIDGRERARGELSGFANPVFSAPELLRGEAVDPRADLWSLGTLAWLMLTGALPVDDTDRARAIDAVREGRLQPWPGVPGAPKRLVQLVQQCLRLDPDERPASAREVRERLAALRQRGRPLLARVATSAAALAVVATMLVTDGEAKPVFLRPLPGSALELTDRPLVSTSPTVDLRARSLETLGCHFAGFVPTRLRGELARGGEVLLRIDLRPETDRDAGTLLLSTAQPAWRDLVQGLVRASLDGPVDLAFVVPGAALLGAARVRLDADAPEVEAKLVAADSGLAAASGLSVEAHDDVAVAKVVARVAFDGRDAHVLELPVEPGVFEIGRALARTSGSVLDLGPGTVVVEATDRAGNVRATAPIAFASCDVASPQVLEVTGPAGESHLTRIGERLRFRVRLSHGEPGSKLVCRANGRDQAVEVQLTSGPSDGPVWQPVEVAAAALGDETAELLLQLVVTDARGNTAAFDAPVAVRDRSLSLEFVPVSSRGEHAAHWDGSEIVLAPAGGEVLATVGRSYTLAGARLDARSPLAAADAVRFAAIDRRSARLAFGAVEPGLHTLLLTFEELDSGPSAPLERRVPVRVLPPIELRLPFVRPRYLSQYLQNGLLARRGKALVEGAAWRLDPGLRRYVGGELWVGEDAPVALAVPSGVVGGLLPDVVPVPGRNVLAVSLRDVLGRPVVVLDESGGRRAEEQRVVVADFWWHDGGAELIGEELLVEHGQPARFRLRFPLPFTAQDREALRLGILQTELPANQLVLDGSRAVVSFEVPFAVWSVAVQLADVPRERYAERIARRLLVYALTPAGRFDVELRLRTARSTLAAISVGDLGDVPVPLRGLRLLPVLGPSEPFVEPVPTNAPPRATFRPQPPVPVRNVPDFLLQDRELTWGHARALAAVGAALVDEVLRRRCVHGDDALGVDRLDPAQLLPPTSPAPDDDAALSGIDFFQAYTLSRLLGVAVAGDPELFRLPLGCELELAAYAGATREACHGAAAHGGSVSARSLLVPPSGGGVPADRLVAAGDVVPTPYGADFVGLDFGVREWVLDLPHVRGAEILLVEWVSDHEVHLRKVLGVAAGTEQSPQNPLGPLRQLGVVRGLACGELQGLVGRDGERLELRPEQRVPATVPGVLRVEQLRRDGNDLLRGRDPRLAHVGMRVAGDARQIVRRWGGR